MRILSICCLCVLISSTAIANNLPNFPFLTASGYASIEVQPDEARIQFYLLNFNKQSDRAMSELNKTSYALTKFLLENGMDKEQISTDTISKQSRRQQHQRSYQVLDILGYEVTQRFQLNLTDLALFETVMNKLLTTDLVESIDVDFDISNRDEIESQLIIDAGGRAKSKGKLLAKGVGVKIESVFAVNDTADGQLVPNFQIPSASFSAFSMKSASKANIFIPNTIKLEKRLTVMYKIAN